MTSTGREGRLEEEINVKTLITIVKPTTFHFNTNETLDQGQRLLIDLVSLSWVELITKLWGNVSTMDPQ